MEKDRIISRGIFTHADTQATCNRYSFAVRCTHWIFACAFFVLVFSSLPILIAHPRFYWGETGALGTHPLFVLPLPLWVGRSGWGRSLHFLAAWVALFAGIVYVTSGVFSGHFRSRLVPTRADLTWSNLCRVIAEHLSRSRDELKTSLRYNVVQRLAYLLVVFVLFPLIILSGLAMSPAITSVAPWLVEMFGGHQSARTLHFIFSQLLEAFFIVHLVMVARAGFVSSTRSMIVGDASSQDLPTLDASGVSFASDASFTSKGVADA
jgi:thiosulfate reductase cytochrome b subunit